MTDKQGSKGTERVDPGKTALDQAAKGERGTNQDDSATKQGDKPGQRGEQAQRGQQSGSDTHVGTGRNK